jgi:hypothetical protein
MGQRIYEVSLKPRGKVDVIVFDRAKEMQVFMKGHGLPAQEKLLGACAYEESGPVWAVILLNKETVSTFVVAHELMHASVQIARRKWGKTWEGKGFWKSPKGHTRREETLADVMGNLAVSVLQVLAGRVQG